MLPLFIIAVILTVGSLYGIFNDFSVETIFICFLCMIPLWIFLRLMKAIFNMISIDTKLKNLADKSKLIKIDANYGWLIKFSEK